MMEKTECRRMTHLRVPVFHDEKVLIQGNARCAGLSTARYLRTLGQGYPLRPVIALDALQSLSKVNADLARLGNLQKLWLDNDARTARFDRATIERLLQRIDNTLLELRSLIQSLDGWRIQP